MKNNCTTREYLKTDFTTVVKKYIEVFSAEPWNDTLKVPQIEEYLKSMENMNTFLGYIFEDTNKIIVGCALGFIRPWYQGKEYHMDTFFIVNNSQKKGLGNIFLREVKKDLVKRNIPTIVLDTDRETPAEKFYLNNQFYTIKNSITLYSSTEEK